MLVVWGISAGELQILGNLKVEKVLTPPNPGIYVALRINRATAPSCTFGYDGACFANLRYVTCPRGPSFI